MAGSYCWVLGGFYWHDRNVRVQRNLVYLDPEIENAQSTEQLFSSIIKYDMKTSSEP